MSRRSRRKGKAFLWFCAIVFTMGGLINLYEAIGYIGIIIIVNLIIGI